MKPFDKDVQWCIHLCNLLGVNPLKKNDIFQNCIVLFSLLSIIGKMFFTILMLCTNEDKLSVESLTNVTTSLLMFPHGIGKLMTVYIYKKEIAQLFIDTRDNFWTPDETEEIKRSHRLKKFLKNFCINCILFCLSSSIVKPFVTGRRASAYQKYKPDSFPRYFFLVLEDIALVSSLLPILCLDVMVCVLLMMGEVQFRMLNEKLKNLYNFNQDHGTKKQVYIKLKECVDHQNFLIDYVNRFNIVFSGLNLFYLGDIILTMCMRMYIISNDNTAMNIRIEALVHIIAGLIDLVSCFVIPAQALMDQADEISNSVYFSNWYEHPDDAKCVLQIMLRDKKKIEITAGGVVMMDVQMYLKAVKTTISYCMFLRTMGIVK